MSFDLEKCFTLIDLEFREALQEGRQTDANHLRDVAFRLKRGLGETFSEFDHHFSSTMYNFGPVVWNQPPSIITFSYDTYLEQALESGSGVSASGYPASKHRLPSLDREGAEREFTDPELLSSHFSWNRHLAYGSRFDVVKIHQAGVSQYVEGIGSTHHPENTPYDWSLLKLQGWINWFRYQPFRKYPAFEAVEPLPPSETGTRPFG